MCQDYEIVDTFMQIIYKLQGIVITGLSGNLCMSNHNSCCHSNIRSDQVIDFPLNQKTQVVQHTGEVRAFPIFYISWWLIARKYCSSWDGVPDGLCIVIILLFLGWCARWTVYCNNTALLGVVCQMDCVL